jgi:anaerobic ribonucleoside-triphosphate reductase activating protein
MNIGSTQYSLKYKSFEIYISGCYGSCRGCCNPELKEFSYGHILDENSLTKIINKIKEFDILIDSIWILGGDPIDQNKNELLILLHRLQQTNKLIWLWTRYDLDYISKEIRQNCDYIKCGEYKANLKNSIQYEITLASNNQKIYKKGLDY